VTCEDLTSTRSAVAVGSAQIVTTASATADTGPRNLNAPFYTGPLPQLALSDFGFDAFVLGSGRCLILPYWFLTLVAGSLAMLCRLRWPLRFTLRSLFIATTFLAVVLGTIAWLVRAWIGK
jgi:hypothetical protein